jgi:hypothetical protein
MEAVAKLDALGIELLLPDNALFFDLGYVPSIVAQRKQLHIQYKNLKALADPRNYDEELHKGTFGEHYFVWDGPELHLGHRHDYVYTKRRDFGPLDLYSRAHEHTHVLEHYGGLALLSERLFREQNVRINFSMFRWITEDQRKFNEEVIAELGAIYALHAAGYGIDFLPTGLKASVGFPQAKAIYERSRSPMKTFSLPSTPIDIQQLQAA